MVGFWETSAIVPLLVPEPDTERRERELADSDGAIVWWGTCVECHSALCRREREGVLTRENFIRAAARLDALIAQCTQVEPDEAVRRRAERLLRVHPLRAADAFQLAAALAAVQERPEGVPFHCADERLRVAAQKEGFSLV
jgi:uncharacterized protein